MDGHAETAALVALLRIGRRPWSHVADDVEAAGSASAVLERGGTGEAEVPRLFDPRPVPDLAQSLELAARDLAAWQDRGITVRTILDPDYPPNLRVVHDRPPLLFTTGRDAPLADERAIAVIGSRRASEVAIELTGDISRGLATLEYVVISGLARGVDTAAHTATLDASARTIAVIGTGLDHAYPPENTALQRGIAAAGAVVSQFWPATPAAAENFPRRNALMSGLARATLIVEGGPRSGTRIQARAALGHGRPVLLHEHLMSEPWARQLAERQNVHVIASAAQAVEIVERRHRSEPLTA